MLDLLIIICLMLINGFFAMAEISIVSSKRMRLQQQSEEGSHRATVALTLVDAPSRSLSTIQIGITLIGIFTGAFGEASLVSKLGRYLSDVPVIGPHADIIALIVVVICITFGSLILGELVPKRLAMQYPERVATLVAIPMTWLSRIVAPFVWVLSITTDFILRLLRLNSNEAETLTEDDISGILKEGATAGLFEKTEHEIVSRALSLDDQAIVTIMTPRNDVHYIDLENPLEETLSTIADSPYSRFPVCDNGLDNIIGMIDAGTLFAQQIRGQAINIRQLTKPALFVPESISAMDLLETFQQRRAEMAIVINEYGETEGIVTLRDILKVLVGYTIHINDEENADSVQRQDGSWLVDGGISLDRFREIFHTKLEFPKEEDEDYHTLAGFVLQQLGHIPKAAEHFTYEGFYFEVVDMDKHRIDRLLIKTPT